VLLLHLGFHQLQSSSWYLNGFLVIVFTKPLCAFGPYKVPFGPNLDSFHIIFRHCFHYPKGNPVLKTNGRQLSAGFELKAELNPMFIPVPKLQYEQNQLLLS
jgi:hypothetical protein